MTPLARLVRDRRRSSGGSPLAGPRFQATGSARPGFRPATPRQRGFALLIVLWTLVLLSLLLTQLTSAGRGEAQIALNLRRDAAAELAADGAVQAAMFHLLDGSNQRWTADGTERRLAVPHGTATLLLRDQAGKVNPNTAPPELLAGLIAALGQDPRTAGTIAQAIVDWRTTTPVAGQSPAAAAYRAASLPVAPAGTPFGDVEDVRLVLGMTPALFDALRPHLSIFAVGEPRIAYADKFVAQAILATGGGTGVGAQTTAEITVVEIAATVHTTAGASFTRRAVVQVGGSSQPPWRILDWREGAPA